MSLNRRPFRPDNDPALRSAPEIWAGDGPRLRFDIRAFARVSLLQSRRSARPVLLGANVLLLSAAEVMAENTIGPRFARAWRVGHILPARDTLARGLTAGADMMTAAADAADRPPAEPVVLPPEPEPLSLSFSRSERRAALAPPKAVVAPPIFAPVVSAGPQEEFDGPTLAVIRAMMGELVVTPDPAPDRSAPVAPLPPTGRQLLMHGIPLQPADPLPRTITERLAATAYGLAAWLLAAAVTLLALPFGLIAATRAQMKGDDLRSWS